MRFGNRARQKYRRTITRRVIHVKREGVAAAWYRRHDLTGIGRADETALLICCRPEVAAMAFGRLVREPFRVESHLLGQPLASARQARIPTRYT